MLVAFELPGGKWELVESPGVGESVKAYGSRQAVFAAANLICGFHGWRDARIVDYAQREEDKRCFGELGKAADRLTEACAVQQSSAS